MRGGREDGTRTHARIDLRSPPAILGRLGGGQFDRIRGSHVSASARTDGSNPGGGNTWDSILERRRPDSNRGIKALQASALPLGYGA